MQFQFFLSFMYRKSQTCRASDKILGHANHRYSGLIFLRKLQQYCSQPLFPDISDVPEDVDPYDLLEPVNILAALPKDYYDKIVSTWSWKYFSTDITVKRKGPSSQHLLSVKFVVVQIVP